MSQVQVLIAGILLQQEQADAVLCAAEIMFYRSERFLRDVIRPNRDKLDEHLNNYLRCAEIIHLFDRNKKFDYVHFNQGQATLKGNVETVFRKPHT